MKLAFIDCGVSQSETPQRIIDRLEPTLSDNGISLLHNSSSISDEEYLVVRWGSPRFSQLDNNARGVLNRASSITFNINKFQAHSKMMEAGVSVPKFWTTFQQARRGARELGCDFLRRRKRHTQGKDIIRLSVTDSLSQSKRSGYYVELLNKTAEYRLHIFKGECIGLAQKVAGNHPNTLIWNFENGWDLNYIARDDREDAVPHYARIKREATNACNSLNLDFGAVDLVMVESVPYILEVNTAPKLAQTKRYSKNIVRWIEETRGRRLRHNEVD